MTEGVIGEIAWDSGEFLSARALMIPVYDTGFVQGVTISEQLRTFGGKLFRAAEHFARLERSLEIVGIDPGCALAEIERAAHAVAERNHSLLAAGDDLACAILVSPGAYAAMAPPGEDRPRVRIHSYPLPFAGWHRSYEEGVALAIPAIRQTPANCWPPELKCRSRMHYFLADREAKKIDPASRAIMLDQAGDVLEATTANLLMYSEREGIVAPPAADILPGVSMRVLLELAAKLGIPFCQRRIAPAELTEAAEVLLCSTSPCVWPAVRLDGKSIGRVGVGTIARQLLEAWSSLVGLDIAEQAKRFAKRGA